MYDRTTKDCKLFSGSLDDLRADCNEIGYPREPSYDSCDVVFSGDDGCYVSKSIDEIRPKNDTNIS